MENFRHFASSRAGGRIREHAFLTDPGYFQLNFKGQWYRLPAPRLYWSLTECGDALRINYLLGIEGKAEKDLSHSRFFFPAFPNQGDSGRFCDKTEPVWLTPYKDHSIEEITEGAQKYITRFMMGTFNYDITYWRYRGWSPFWEKPGAGELARPHAILTNWAKTSLTKITSKNFYPFSIRREARPRMVNRGYPCH